MSITHIHPFLFNYDTQVWAWGYNTGSVGHERQSPNVGVDRASSPVIVFLSSDSWTSIGEGMGPQNGIISKSGRLYMWGYDNTLANQSGALGTYGRTNDSSPGETPREVLGNYTDWSRVAAIRSFPDAPVFNKSSNTTAIKTDGSLWAWGYVPGLNDNRSSPVVCFLGNDWKEISAGESHLAAIKTDGTLWLWGQNIYGELGDNSRTNRSSPVQTVAGGANWKQISCTSDSNTAAIKTDGTLWIWGRNNNGQLGDNTTADKSSPVQTVSGGTNWRQVSLGGGITTAIKTDGTLWLWGQNSGGALGDNTVISKSSPVQTVATGTDWKLVVAGDGKADLGTYFVAALKSNGSLWTWGGASSWGYLGDNTNNTAKSSPVLISSGGTNWVNLGVAGGQGRARVIGINNEIYIEPEIRSYQDGYYTAASSNIASVAPAQTTYETISTTETTGDRYAFFWQGNFPHAGTNADVSGILFESPTIRQAYNLESQDTTDQFSMGGVYAYSGGTNRTITLDANEESANTNSIQNYSLFGLKLNFSDQFGHSAGQSDSVSSTYAAKTSVTLEVGTWLIIASASVLQSAAGVTKVRVFDGTTAYGEQSGTVYAQDTTNWVPYWSVRQVTVSASTTFELQWGRVAATGTASIRQATILALDLSRFDNVYYSEQLTDQNTTSTTVFGGVGLSSAFTIKNPRNRHLIIGCAWTIVNATTRSTVARLYNTTTATDLSGVHQREANATTERYPTIVARTAAFSSNASNNAQTLEWQHYVGQGTGTATIGQMAIAVLDLGQEEYITEPPYQIWGMGFGNWGTVGDNSSVSKSSPVQIIGATTDWQTIPEPGSGGAAGGHQAAIRNTGTLWLWGSNGSGQLGNNANGAGNATTNSRSSPVQTAAGGSDWKAISVSGSLSAAIRTNNSLWLWGNNSYGQLGLNDNGNTSNQTNARSSPVQVFGGGTNWSKVSIGVTHTAAIKSDGTLWLWGSNLYGELGQNDNGNGTTTTNSRSSPVQVLGGGTNWKQVSCGAGHTAAVKTNGELWLWGQNGHGQLGDNTNGGLSTTSVTNSKSSPVQTVSGGTDWSQVACGQYFTAAIKSDGTLWLWGRNNRGQLGDYTGTNPGVARSSPVQTIAGGTNWKSVSCGLEFTYASTIDNVLYGWGDSTFGALASQFGSDEPRVMPVPFTQTWVGPMIGSTYNGYGLRNNLRI